MASINLGPNVNSYTVLPQHFANPNFAFEFDKQYVIEISIIQTKDGLSNNLNNDNIQAIARSYADFTRVQDGGPVVNLPVIQADGSYLFNMVVVPDQIYFIDPEVAIGYDYAIGLGNPNFAAVQLPTSIGDGLYDLWGFDDANQLILLADDLVGGTMFNFGTGGVSRCRVDRHRDQRGRGLTAALALHHRPSPWRCAAAVTGTRRRRSRWSTTT